MHATTASPSQQDLFAKLAGYRGPVSLPGTRREIWWTGRVAIGLLYQPNRTERSLCTAERWIQEQLLRTS